MKTQFYEKTDYVFSLGAFVKLLKVTISFVMSVRLSICPSVHTEQLGYHWTDFHEILYMSIFLNSLIKFKLREDLIIMTVRYVKTCIHL